MEDYQFIESTFVELINSLLSAGEIPGLYAPDEFESILSPLREESSQEGFRGTMVQYFAQSNHHPKRLSRINGSSFSRSKNQSPYCPSDGLHSTDIYHCLSE